MSALAPLAKLNGFTSHGKPMPQSQKNQNKKRYALIYTRKRYFIYSLYIGIGSEPTSLTKRPLFKSQKPTPHDDGTSHIQNRDVVIKERIKSGKTYRLNSPSHPLPPWHSIWRSWQVITYSIRSEADEQPTKSSKVHSSRKKPQITHLTNKNKQK